MGTDDCTIVAESFSGPLAITIAAAKPDRLKALILVASFSRSPRRLAAFQAFSLYLLPLRCPGFTRLTQRLLVGKWGLTFPEDFVKILRRIPRSTLVGRLRAVAQVDVSASLTVIPVRKLTIAASADALVPRSQAGIFAEAGWTSAVIEGPHFLTATRAEDVAIKIERFLDSHGIEVSHDRL